MAKPTKKQLDYIESLVSNNSEVINRLGIIDVSPDTDKDATNLILQLKNLPTARQMDYFDNLVSDIEAYGEDLGLKPPREPELPKTKEEISEKIETLKTKAKKLKEQQSTEDKREKEKFDREYEEDILEDDLKHRGNGCLLILIITVAFLVVYLLLQQ